VTEKHSTPVLDRAGAMFADQAENADEEWQPSPSGNQRNAVTDDLQADLEHLPGKSHLEKRLWSDGAMRFD
jgi:hypothetical protein